MRKRLLIILLLVLLMFPMGVFAKKCDTSLIKIEKVSISEKSDKVVEVKPPQFEDKKLTINVKFKEVGDSITYKLLIKNDSKEDFELGEEIDKETDYIEYKVKSGSGIIKAGKEKEFYVQITYKKKVEAKSFDQGKYLENASIPFDLSSNLETSVINSNNQNNVIFIIISVMVILVTLFVKGITNKVSTRKYLFVLLPLLLIPITVSALCNCKIEVDANIEIDNPIPTIKVKYVNCGTLIDGNYEYREGMTLKEWVYSDYLNDWVTKRVTQLGVSEEEKVTKMQLERQYLLEDLVQKVTHDENYIIKNNDVLEYNNSEC